MAEKPTLRSQYCPCRWTSAPHWVAAGKERPGVCVANRIISLGRARETANVEAAIDDLDDKERRERADRAPLEDGPRKRRIRSSRSAMLMSSGTYSSPGTVAVSWLLCQASRRHAYSLGSLDEVEDADDVRAIGNPSSQSQPVSSEQSKLACSVRQPKNMRLRCSHGTRFAVAVEVCSRR